MTIRMGLGMFIGVLSGQSRVDRNSIEREKDMRTALSIACVAALATLLASPAHAQTACTRAQLQTAVDSYITAQGKGDPTAMKLATQATHVENMQPSTLDKSILRTPLKIDFHRSLLDTTACETFTEVIVTDKAHPYVIGMRLRVVLGQISEVDAMITDQGDWLFNADNYLKHSPKENWSVIPAAARDTRETLSAAANAYEDAFLDNAVVVPWGMPCNRLEGGIRTGKDAPEDSCTGGLPSGMIFSARRIIIDQDIGAAVLLSKFTTNLQPDSHLFRVEKGKIRYVHTLTVCTIPNCGFPGRAPAPAPAPVAR
jgi:hypothetical protein